MTHRVGRSFAKGVESNLHRSAYVVPAAANKRDGGRHPTREVSDADMISGDVRGEANCVLVVEAGRMQLISVVRLLALR